MNAKRTLFLTLCFVSFFGCARSPSKPDSAREFPSERPEIGEKSDVRNRALAEKAERINVLFKKIKGE